MSTRTLKLALSILILTSTLIDVWAADPVTVVTYPLMNRPVVCVPGESFTIFCNADASASGWQAQLQMPYDTVDLTITAEYSSTTQRWILTATIPADTPFELYDLVITASGGIEDQVHHAVRVIPEYRNEFYFVHLPDTHLPAVSWIGYYDDENTVPELRELIKEFAVINPEFVLQTGDLVDNGQQEEQYQLAQELLADLSVPIFITGGNHDLWYDGHQNWHKYFGRTMDYSFNYGTYHFAGLEMYDIPTVTFTAEQMHWLQADLNRSLERGDAMRFLFYHYDESRQIDADFVDQYQIDMMLYGHTHINGVSFVGTRQVINANTSFTMNNNGEFRLVKVSNGEVTDYPVLKFKRLQVQYSPANDGSNWIVNAKIVNDNLIGFDNGLIRFFVPDDPAGYTVQGGEVQQVLSSQNQKIYYVTVNIQPQSTQMVSIQSLNPPSNHPPLITHFSPSADTTIPSNQSTLFSIEATDSDGDPLSYQWLLEGTPIPDATSSSFSFTPSQEHIGVVTLQVIVSDQSYHDTKTWEVEVEEFSPNPELITSVINFFKYNEPLTLEWREPVSIQARLEYGRSPGDYSSGSIAETGDAEVTFVPQQVGMSLGRYYCRITDGTLSSAEFTIIIESPNAPRVLAPLGNIKELSPTFSWEAVPGVPYYMLICSDKEIVIREDPITGETTVEGANPIWAVLTSETSVPYGISDPSGTFTSMPAPLAAGHSYWWVVLNCYGNAPELTSPVQSGVSKFTVDLPPPDVAAPQLLAPADNDTLESEVITFQWSAVDNAIGYHFYPFKIEIESGIETARPIWESVITTTNTYLDYEAGSLLIAGDYCWKVGAVTANGLEVHSETRDFHYNAPSATISVHTYDNRGTATVDDDVALPRVKVEYRAIDGIYNGLPLSTDLHGNRESFTIAPGTYIFTASKEGFESEVDTLRFQNGDTRDLDFRLSPSPSSIFGQVVDQDSIGVGNATIEVTHSLHPTIHKETASDAVGNFSVSVLPGPYVISANKEGYHSSLELSISVANGENRSLSAPLVLVKNFNKISGIVVNQNNQPVFGATITLQKGEITLTTYTDANGHFEFVVDSGTWQLQVAKEGFVSPPSRSIYITNGETIVVEPNPVLMPNAGIVNGYVTDNQKVLSGVTISAIPTAGSVVTVTSDAYGQFSLNLSAGTYLLQARLAGYTASENPQITINPGETISGIKLVLTPNQSKIVGSVTIDGVTPLGGAEISTGTMRVLTKSNGSYEFSVEAGQYVLSAFKEGYTSSGDQQVTVAPGQAVEGVNFVLTPNASVIKGWVSSSGRPLFQAQVTAENGISVSTLTNESGHYVLNVDAGNWNISVSKPGFQSASRSDVVVGVGQTAEGINFDLQRNIATIIGTVKETAHGAPLRNAKIEVLETDAETATKSDGSFTLIVEPGSYTLQVYKQGYDSQQKATGELSVNATVEVDFSLNAYPSQISGVIQEVNSQPVFAAQVMAISGSDTVTSWTDIGGKFRLDVEAGSYILKAFKPGYAQSGSPPGVTVAAGEQKSDVILTMQRQFAGLEGTVRDSLTQTPVPGVQIQIADAGGTGGSVTSDNLGFYQFVDQQGQPFLAAGEYTVTLNKSGYRVRAVSGIWLNPSETKTVDFQLAQNLGFLAGEVTDGATGIIQASVIATHVQSQQRYTAITDSSGSFRLQNILAGAYVLSASKTEYTSPEALNVSTNADNLQIVLTRNVGCVHGVVTDKESQTPIGGVYIYATDDYGTYGRTYTDSQGGFQLNDLPTQYLYTVSASRGGYRGDTRTGVSAADTAALYFQLERLYGSITGRTLKRDQSGLAGVVVKAISGSTTYVDTTDVTGQYNFPHLPSGQYDVSARKIGYLSDPSQRSLGLWSGEAHTNVDFVMTEAVSSTITIIGPNSIDNSTSQKYSYVAITADGRHTDIDPLWEVDFPDAVDSLSSFGILYPKPTYVGPLRLSLTDQYSKAVGYLDISVYQKLSAGNEAVEISDEKGVSLAIPDSAVSEGIILQLKSPPMPEVRRSTSRFQVLGEVYEFTPNNFKLNKAATLRLPIPQAAITDKNTVGRWERNTLSWVELGGEELTSGSLEVKIDRLGRYAVLTLSKPLAIEKLSLTPNPFSPLTGPLKISYETSSNVTTYPIVTAIIYNMVGDLVKTLLNEEPQPKGANEIHWNGQTDYNRMALNGRYVLYMAVRDRTGVRQKLKSFVLIK